MLFTIEELYKQNI